MCDPVEDVETMSWHYVLKRSGNLLFAILSASLLYESAFCVGILMFLCCCLFSHFLFFPNFVDFLGKKLLVFELFCF